MTTHTFPAFHPDQFLLNDYVAGSLPGAVALTLAAHLEFCPSCRHEVHELEQVGADLFAGLDPVPVGDEGLSRVFERIDAGSSPLRTPRPEPTLGDGRRLPRVLGRLMPHGVDLLRWKRSGAALRTAALRFGDNGREVALQHIAAGGRVPEHGHGGHEFTVVLRGGFSDRDGAYQPGDFLVRGPDDVHRPVAAPGDDCLCLSVLEAPVRLTGLLGRVVNPFLRLDPG